MRVCFYRRASSPQGRDAPHPPTRRRDRGGCNAYLEKLVVVGPVILLHAGPHAENVQGLLRRHLWSAR